MKTMDKRTQLTTVLAATALAVAGVWFGLISPQKDHLAKLAERKHKAETKLQQVNVAIKEGPRVEADVADKIATLQTLETSMASGDLYSWMIATLRQFKTDYRVDIPQFSQLDGPKDVSLLPGFPYKQVSVTVGGTGSYTEVGKFISELENEFPYMRLLNLTLEPSSPMQASEPQKLAFKMDVVALVKPVNSLLAKTK